jgi:DNA polymerase-3 subunit delta
VRGLNEAPAKALDRLRDAIERARARAGGWPVEGTTVALLAVGTERKSPALRVLPPADHVELKAPAPRALPGWLRSRARAAGLDLAPAAAETLVELVGEDLSRLAGELEKAAVFVGPDGRISAEVVRALAGESRVRRYWELAQALEEANRARALAVLTELLDGGEEPTVLLGQIAGHLRDVWRVKSALAEGQDPRDSTTLRRGRPAFAVERVMAREEALAGADLAVGLGRCFDVEVRLKSRGGQAGALLTVLVAELARA